MIDSRQHIIGKLIPYDFETITVEDTPIGLTAAILNASPKPKKVFITVETAQIRYRMDGTDPEAAVGHIANPMDSIILEGYSQINNFMAIRKETTSGKIQATYLR